MSNYSKGPNTECIKAFTIPFSAVSQVIRLLPSFSLYPRKVYDKLAQDAVTLGIKVKNDSMQKYAEMYIAVA